MAPRPMNTCMPPVKWPILPSGALAAVMAMKVPFQANDSAPSTTHSTVMAAAGGVLEWFEHENLARAGFATIFAVGGLGRLYSLWQLAGITDPGLATDAEGLTSEPGGLRRLWQSNFLRYSLSIGLMLDRKSTRLNSSHT